VVQTIKMRTAESHKVGRADGKHWEPIHCRLRALRAAGMEGRKVELGTVEPWQLRIADCGLQIGSLSQKGLSNFSL